MVKVSVLYPSGEDAKFDMDYYVNSHIKLVRDLLGAALKGVEVDEGISQPNAPAPFLCVGHLFFESAADIQAAFDIHGANLRADVPNYTNVQPMFLVSTVRVSGMSLGAS
ncbi:MAG TPA: EthD family reductase [Bryobacteraceae bacterium]|nr:EthD family reductase [Bryobacteraceae bacterium]